MKIKVNEAIAMANARGKRVMKKDIAERIFEGSSDAAKQVNMTNLCNGTTKRICPEWVVTICKMCECSADFLFGLKEE